MFKHFFLFFISFTILFSFSFSYNFKENFKNECFKYSDFLTGVKSDTTIKIKTKKSSIFPVSNGNLLNYKIFSYGEPENISYEIKDVSSNKDGNLQYIYDGNKETYFEFNIYDNTQKTIILELPRVLPENYIRSFNFDASFYDEVNFLISKNNEDYIKVNRYNIDEFSFKYLKIVFKDFEEKQNTKINEINFYGRGENTFLINTINDKINFFTNYMCKKDEEYKKRLNEYKTKNNKENYPINADTSKFDINFKLNPDYDKDFDNDGIENRKDNCIFEPNKNQKDSDKDLIGDKCDKLKGKKNTYQKDSDNDGVINRKDNCKFLYNPKQTDTNSDHKGDLCSDDDNDGIIGYKDNCINIKNPSQKDINNNGIGDACEFDKDEDGVFDSIDNCINIKNPQQKDNDNDGIGNKCDNCDMYNPQQEDNNNNGIGDKCEQEKNEPDKDNDSVSDMEDNCISTKNPKQKDTDGDNIGDKCDNCKNLKNNSQKDKNGNGTGDICEDIDNDGYKGHIDNCPYIKNPHQKDNDNDGIGYLCEDPDHDDILNKNDNCKNDYNPKQRDVDNDGIGKACDEKDDRFIESNKWFFAGIASFIALVFIVLIVVQLKKLNK